MHFILKTTPGMTYVELWSTPTRKTMPMLIGHFNLSTPELHALTEVLHHGAANTSHTFETTTTRPSEITGVWVDEQAQVDAVFEEAIHQGASPEPITAAEPPPPSGREVIYQRPVSIPDPVGKSPSTEHRTRRTCCASFVGDPHGYGCQLVAADPLTPRSGLDGSAQTERIKNARQGGAIDAGEVIDLGPVSQQGETRFVAVKGPGANTIEGFGWNALDRETGRYRMPGWVCSEGAARRTAERANADPEQFAPRYIWEG